MKRSMLLNCFFSILFLFASITIYSQQNDPIHWGSPIHLIQGENIFMLWSKQDNGGSGYVSKQKIFKFLNDSTVAPDQQLLGTQVHQSSTAGVSGNRQMDVATGYLTNGAFQNVIAAWEGPNQAIKYRS